ncbi:uncharacterized protein [Coffea arabica]|uniref:Uncharacterized protein isoform X2 n=1 Tax=Coffea arabica TaxID=13443 RepID=A0A6P6UXK5_COFAR|nr:uncharacterized protein LOC113715225 isoform X2 [Coffea arabica]
MSSLTLRPSLLSQSSSSPSASASSSNCSLALVSWRNNWQNSSSINCRTKSSAYKGRLILRAQSFDSSSEDSNNKNNNSNAAGSQPSNGTLHKSRREILLEYVQNVQPEFMELFVKRAPQQVVEAMRHTVTNMIGTLPPQFFAVTVTTVAENLAQLMYSVLMTGYMFRNAQYRIELQQSLEQVALPEPPKSKDGPEFAPGTQKKVTGEVIRWNNVSGPEKLDAVKYIELLEAEIEELNRQIERKSSDGQNDLLDYLKTLEPQNLKTSVTETSAPELAKLLYWLMVVGYSIRNIEVRFDMERVLGTPPKLAELPPGENI